MSFRVLADQSLPDLEMAFPAPFKITYYDSIDTLKAALPAHDILICRSTLKVNASLLSAHSLKWILTASSGRDHLDETFLKAHAIQILDAKGANANAVGDYVLACLSTLALFHAFHPQTIGIIGLGAVGSRLYQRLLKLGFRVSTYDPYHPGPQHVALNKLAHCDLICIHANLHSTPPYPSLGLLDASFLRKRKPHQAIINASRGGIVDEKALVACHQGIYCTDVFCNEPHLNPQVVEHATLCTPHIAGHTIEAKLDVIRQLSHQLHLRLGLTPPSFSPHRHVALHAQPATSWQAQIHSQYNPLDETKKLKSSLKLNETFLALRRGHRRHALELSLDEHLV